MGSEIGTEPRNPPSPFFHTSIDNVEWTRRRDNPGHNSNVSFCFLTLSAAPREYTQPPRLSENEWVTLALRRQCVCFFFLSFEPGVCQLSSVRHCLVRRRSRRKHWPFVTTTKSCAQIYITWNMCFVLVRVTSRADKNYYLPFSLPHTFPGNNRRTKKLLFRRERVIFEDIITMWLLFPRQITF